MMQRSREGTGRFELLAYWEHYFETRHEGLGATYERFVLHGYFKRIKDQYGVKTVLEAPVFGMTGISGINSVWWAVHRARVTLVDHNRERLAAVKKVWQELSLQAELIYNPGTYSSLPFADREFDMSWNFAALHSDIEPEVLMQELARVTRKVIFICVPNPMHLFGLLLNSWPKELRGLRHFNMTSAHVEKIMTASGWQLKERGVLVVPPWPDIAMPKEELLRRIGLRRYARRLEKEIARKDRICILDYYSGRNKEMKREMCRYGFLENSPNWLKTVWAHHRYFVFVSQHSL
jgi:hypothetical protein